MRLVDVERAAAYERTRLKVPVRPSNVELRKRLWKMRRRAGRDPRLHVVADALEKEWFGK